jgi:hypothetical protein
MTTERTKYVKIKYKPKPDITAWELAIICDKYDFQCIFINIDPDEWNKLSDDIKKHFEVLP